MLYEQKILEDLGRYFPLMNVHDEIKSMSVLLNNMATRRMRFGMVCTFCYYGYTEEQLFQYIEQYNKWKDFNIGVTKKAIHKAYMYKQHNMSNGAQHQTTNSTFLCSAPLSITDPSSYIEYFCKGYAIPSERIPSDMMSSVYHHIARGRIALPKMKGKKRVWFSNRRGKEAYQWKFGERDYTRVLLSMDDVKQWDYSHGICLIVPGDWRDDCYLDIDVKGEKHKDGVDREVLIEWSETIMKGFHFEWTTNGGIHVFGKGHPHPPPAGCGVELIKTLIVTYPTHGYMIDEYV